MRETMRVLKHLITKGSINDRNDRELFALANQADVWDELDTFADEWQFYVVRTMHDMYLVPLQDNDMFNVKLREVRESVSTSAKNIDAYLQCYITMVVLYMFFGSKNDTPLSAKSLYIKDIVETLDERLKNDNSAISMEEKFQINFRKIADVWNSKVTVNDGRKSSKFELVRTACRFLERQKLMELCDDETEVKPLKRLVNVMSLYYLNETRISEINALFSKEDTNAQNQQN